MPILSIVVPTKNRQELAIWCVRSLIRIASDEVEFIIQDNSTSNSLQSDLEALNDSRIKYENRQESLSVIDNCDYGMQRATGEYITLIGDDDSVNPEIIDACYWAKQNELDALIPSTEISYCWPDFSSRYYGNSVSGTLSLIPFDNSIIHPNIEEELNALMKRAGSRFGKLPKLYYGLIKRSVLLELKQKTGRYFPGISPDMAVAAGISGFVKKYCYIDYPLFIPGSSAKSTAGSSAKREHVGNLEDYPHLSQYYIDNWSSLVPKFWSVPTVWAESAISAVSESGREDLLKTFDFAQLHAHCFVRHPAYLSFILKSLFNAAQTQNISNFSALFAFKISTIKLFCNLAGRVIKHIIHPKPLIGSISINGANNIDEAVEKLQTYLTENNLSFKTSFAD